MKLNDLSPAPGSRREKHRPGRGIGSGLARPVAVATKVKAPARWHYCLALRAANSRCIVACQNSVSFP